MKKASLTYLFICTSHLRIIWHCKGESLSLTNRKLEISVILTDSRLASDATTEASVGTGKWGLNKSKTAPSTVKQLDLASWHSLQRDKVMTKVLRKPTVFQTEREWNLRRLPASLSHKLMCFNVGQEGAVLSKWFSRGCLNDTSSLIAR